MYGFCEDLQVWKICSYHYHTFNIFRHKISQKVKNITKLRHETRVEDLLSFLFTFHVYFLADFRLLFSAPMSASNSQHRTRTCDQCSH